MGRSLAYNVAGIFLLVLCLSLSHAAPAPKHDEIAGTFSFQLDDCPVVTVGYRAEDGSFFAVEYWLVFASKDAEEKAKSIQPDSQVKATGRLGCGGRYRYLIVSNIVEK